MTNGTASETNGILSEATLLPCPFCGGEASWIAARQREDGTYHPASCGCRKCGIQCYGESDYGHGGFATEEDREASMEQAVSKWNTRTPEQAIAATLGAGRLTAEQVEKVIMSSDYWERVNNHPALHDGVWQAIADELNATLVGGECECEGTIEWQWAGPTTYYEHELSCGHVITSVDNEPPNFCEECGRKIRKAVKRG